MNLPLTSTTSAPAGKVTSERGPTERTRPSVTTNTPSSSGSASVPSIIVAPTKAIVPSFANVEMETNRNPNSAKALVIALIIAISSCTVFERI